MAMKFIIKDFLINISLIWEEVWDKMQRKTKAKCRASIFYLPCGLRITDARLDAVPTIRGKAEKWKAGKAIPTTQSNKKMGR